MGKDTLEDAIVTIFNNWKASNEVKQRTTYANEHLLNKKGHTSLSQACLDNNLAEVIKLLQEEPLCIGQEIWNGATAIHVAVKFSSDVEIIKVLLDTNECDLTGCDQYHHNVYDRWRQRGEDLLPAVEESEKGKLVETRMEVIRLLVAKGMLPISSRDWHDALLT